jgi:nucleoredoxin
MDSEFTKWSDFAAEQAEKDRFFQAEVDELKYNFNPVQFFTAHKVVDKEGNTMPGDSLTGKMVGLYFSAHWCQPCRKVTPRLAEKYNAFLANGDALEIIFISSDRDAASATKYFTAEMPWKMLDCDDRVGKALLASAFRVTSIPILLVFNENGDLIPNVDLYAFIHVDSIAKLMIWKEDQAMEEARIAEEIANMPEEVIIEEHEHPLTKIPMFKRGTYWCEVCHVLGVGLLYHCAECSFTIHPACVWKFG